VCSSDLPAAALPPLPTGHQRRTSPCPLASLGYLLPLPGSHELDCGDCRDGVSSIMRKLIVSNFVTLDGYYDGKDKNLSDIFEYFHEDYHGDDTFDFYNTERMRAADTLLLSGRTSFLGNKTYWSSVPDDPNSTAIRREFAGLIRSIEKI